MNPVQNDDANLVNTQAPVVPVSENNNVQVVSPVSVPVGGTEGAPATVSTEAGKVEEFLKPSEVEPQIPDEVANAGVSHVPTEPKLHPHAQAVGVSNSIPVSATTSKFAPPTFASLEDAERVAETTSPGLSLGWIAREVAMKFKRALGNSSQPSQT